MLVIRRLTDRHRAYTGIFLPGEPPRIFPTSDAEHGRILQIYKQDRPYDGVINDFSQYAIGHDTFASAAASATASPPAPARATPTAPPPVSTAKPAASARPRPRPRARAQ